MQATDRDQEDYHFFGTAIEEEAIGNRYRKRVQNPSTTRSLPEWKQVGNLLYVDGFVSSSQQELAQGRVLASRLFSILTCLPMCTL